MIVGAGELPLEMEWLVSGSLIADLFGFSVAVMITGPSRERGGGGCEALLKL